RRTDGILQQAVWQHARVGIPLFRPNRYPRLLAAPDPAGAHRSLLPRRAWHRAHYETSPGAADHRVQAVGRSVRVRPWGADRVGGSGHQEGRSCSTVLWRFARGRRVGVYFIFRSMEQGSKFQILPPKAADPTYRLIKRTRGRFTHFYFYIRDDILGPFVMCVGSFLPFQTTYYLNGHHFIAGELERQGVRFRRDDNAFLWTANPEALQVAADGLTAQMIRKRLDYWTRVLGPKFSAQDRA